MEFPTIFLVINTNDNRKIETHEFDKFQDAKEYLNEVLSGKGDIVKIEGNENGVCYDITFIT